MVSADLLNARERVASFLHARHHRHPEDAIASYDNQELLASDLYALLHATAPRATTRRGDPDTSHAAAASVDQLREKARGVLTVLWHYGPATDQQLEGRYALMRQYDEVPAQSPSGLRSRRAELVRMGMVRDTGERRQISTGRNAIVWAATVPEPAPVVG